MIFECEIDESRPDFDYKFVYYVTYLGAPRQLFRVYMRLKETTEWKEPIEFLREKLIHWEYI